MKIGIIGVGRLGSALVEGLLKSGLAKEDLLATDADENKIRSLSQATGIRMAKDSKEVAKGSDVIFIAVKPQDVVKVLEEISETVNEELVISAAAGVPISKLEEKMGNAKVVRIMPNLACSVGEGTMVYSGGSRIGKIDREAVEELLSKLGMVFELPEPMLDAVTGLSGSGPAYFSLVVKALAEAGMEEGLPEETALKLAAQAAKGTGEILLKTGLSPEGLIDRVRSPRGTTEVGLKKLEEGKVKETFKEAVSAAIRRAKELKG